MSAACNQVRLPAKARQMTSCSFIIRSTAPHAMPMNGLLSIHGCTWVRPKSGHFTCTRERTDHVLPTEGRAVIAPDRGAVYDAPRPSADPQLGTARREEAAMRGSRRAV